MKTYSPEMYDLYWKTVPFGILRDYERWYYPYLEGGVYMLVVATSTGCYVGYYIGKSKDIGNRWRHHLDKWFIYPKRGYWITTNPDGFLENPVAVINAGERGFEQIPKDGASPEQVSNQKMILEQTWFAFADVRTLRKGQCLENIEWVLQEALKRHVGITADKWIGDTGSYRPRSRLSIYNHFSDRPPLEQTLPREIGFDPDQGIL